MGDGFSTSRRDSRPDEGYSHASEARSVVVVGAGAAGTMAALFAARRGLDVLLLERTADGGRKILISGGGRCNILPGQLAPERFVTDSSLNTLRKILTSWPQPEQRSFFERELAMPLVLETETGKLFPATQSARDVRDRLYSRVHEAGAEFRFSTQVVGIELEEGCVRVHTAPAAGKNDVSPCADGPISVIRASSVVLATGGLSVPKTGSDGLGLEMVRRLGHKLIPPYPALTPLIADPPIHASLSGIALEVTLRSPSARPRFETTDALLFTHRGYSGPAILDASHLASRPTSDGARVPIFVQWTGWGAEDWDQALREGRGSLGGALTQKLPNRLARQLLTEAHLKSDVSLAQLTREARQRLVDLLTVYPLPWSGTEGYKKAEVTGGGVPLSEVDPRTMESRRQPGLYFCGEILDAFGPIGGHNFSWAWATGRLVGLSVARGERV